MLARFRALLDAAVQPPLYSIFAHGESDGSPIDE